MHNHAPARSDDLRDPIARIQAGLGGDIVIPGPFGPRPLAYADYTASGRPLDFIEAAIASQVLPFYANTHTETSFTGRQTTRYREQARAAIRQAVGAGDGHAVIFAGSGATAAINRLATALNQRGAGSALGDAVVFIGPYEHHSNELVWRERAGHVIRIPVDDDGVLCFDELERQLAAQPPSGLRIGSFSAASNVTGVRTDMRRLARILHRHGAWFFADYAAAGPYVRIDVSDSAPGAGDGIDAIFLSPHKFVGGPAASGVLVADKRLLTNEVPTVPGGGTVEYVTAGMHRYVANVERREEAGTPSVVGDIRAGLAFALKSEVGEERIEAIEHALVRQAFDRLTANPSIEVLGPRDAERLPIFSFNVLSEGRYLHPNFVVALMNDLFGIQMRGGCSCAGPYGHDLLNIPDERALSYADLVARGFGVYRPGWIRFSLTYFMPAEFIDYVLSSVDFVARRAVDLLPLYRCLPSGRWECAAPDHVVTPAGFDDLCGAFRTEAVQPRQPSTPFDAAHWLRRAEEIADGARALNSAEPDLPDLPWFVTGRERAERVAG